MAQYLVANPMILESTQLPRTIAVPIKWCAAWRPSTQVRRRYPNMRSSPDSGYVLVTSTGPPGLALVHRSFRISIKTVDSKDSESSEHAHCLDSDSEHATCRLPMPFLNLQRGWEGLRVCLCYPKPATFAGGPRTSDTVSSFAQGSRPLNRRGAT